MQSHPDLRWRVHERTIDELVAQQSRILDSARAAVDRVVYSVCTLSPREELVPGGRRTLPHRDDTDGFYIAAG